MPLLYNELSEALKQEGYAASRVATGEMLDFLQFYAKWHFEREENCMEEYHCPAAQANKQAHAYLVTSFGRFYEAWQESDTNPELIRKTYAELGDWIVNHIMRVDTQLRPCVGGHVEPPEPSS